MGDICFMLILSVCVLIQLGTTNGIVFFPFPRSPHSVHPPLSVNQEANTNEVYRPAPFPLFFSIFHYRSPFVPTSDERKETRDNTTDFAEKHEELKSNDSLHNKVNKDSKQEENGKLNAVTSEHHVAKKVINSENENIERPPLERYDFQSRLLQLRHFPFKQPENYWRNKAKEIQSSKQNDTQQGTLTADFSDIKGATNDSLLMATGNCTMRRFMSRYFYVWTINWTSLIIHLVVILLIATLITFGLLSCQQCYSNEQRGQLSKIKPIYI